jgi:hypothetical protein
VESIAEYNAFGPWIDEVRTVEDLPRLFQDAGVDPTTERLVLKVPRDIARRDATPHMHLYDNLIIVGQEHLTVMVRTGATHTTRSVPFEEIVAMENTIALLDGRFVVHTSDGQTLTLTYNGAAGAPVRSLVQLLRNLYLPPRTGNAAEVVEQEHDQPVLGKKDLDLSRSYEMVLLSEPRMRLVSAVPRRIVTLRGNSLRRTLNLAWPVTLQPSIMISDGREVQIIHRRSWFTRPGDNTLSKGRTILPMSKIKKVDIDQHEQYEKLYMVSIHTEGATIRFPTPVGSESSAALAQLSR